MPRPRLTEQDLTNMMSRAIQVKREQNRPLNLRSIGLTIDHAAESSADVPALVEELRVMRQELEDARNKSAREMSSIYTATQKLQTELQGLLSALRQDDNVPEGDLDDLF